MPPPPPQKTDLAQERQVTFLEASRFAQENDIMFVETSALTGEGVDDVFVKCARIILTKIENGTLDPAKVGSGVQLGEGSQHHHHLAPGSGGSVAAAAPGAGCSC